MKERKRITEELRAIDDSDMTDGEYVDALADAVGTSGTSDLLREALAELAETQLPEGVEWPRFEDGELVGIGDEVEQQGVGWFVGDIAFEPVGWSMTLARDLDVSQLRGGYGERVKRWERPKPALDADGVPIEAGDTVYCDNDPKPMTAASHSEDGTAVNVVDDGVYRTVDSSRLSHKRPDSWERLEADLNECCQEGVAGYCSRQGIYCDSTKRTYKDIRADVVKSIVERAKALAKAGE